MKTFKLYARAISYTRPYLHYIAISVVLSLLIVSAESLSLWFSASLVNTLFLPGSTAPLKPTFSINHINEWLKFWTYSIIQRENVFTSLKIVCVLMLGSFFFKNVLSYFKSLLIAKINIFIIRDMRNQIFSHIVNLPVTYYDRNKSGQITSLILNDASAVNNSLVSTFDKLLIEPLRIIFFITMLLVISSKLTIIIASIFPILAYLILEMGKTIRRRSKRNLERFEGMTSVVQETASCIRAVKMFNMALFETDKFKRENDRLNHATFRSILFITLSGPLTETLGVIVTVILLFFGGMEVLKGHSISAEDFVRYLTFLFITFQPFKSLAGVNSTLQGGLAAAQRIFGLLDVQAEPVSISAHERVPSFEKEIKFSEVRFTYPGTAQEVIRGINFTVKKNQIVAIVGSSGSGKSTILDLLPRFYDIQEGSISIDGKDIRENDLLGLRSLFGIVSQETVLFNDSVFNNIGYGLQGASAALVIEAAKVANAWEFIEKLPQGLETIIGERGVMLSGGQRQRLSIARAILKNPAILILDEATSALDTESERLVQSAINNLMTHRTAIIVAHRLSTISHADLILVVENGMILESGPHNDLIKMNRRYKYFYDMQFAEPSPDLNNKPIHEN